MKNVKPCPTCCETTLNRNPGFIFVGGPAGGGHYVRCDTCGGDGEVPQVIACASDTEMDPRVDPNPELTKLVGRLNEALMDAEDWLSDYNRSGVLAKVDLDAESDVKLLFGKHDGRWTLLLEDGRSGRRGLIHKGSIRHKVLASQKLEDLRAAIDAASDERTRSLNEAIDRVRAFLQSAGSSHEY